MFVIKTVYNMRTNKGRYNTSVHEADRFIVVRITHDLFVGLNMPKNMISEKRNLAFKYDAEI